MEGFDLYSQKLLACPISSLSPDLKSGSGAAFHDQFNMDRWWPTLWIFLLGNLDVMTFSFSGSKPHPSDLICRRNSVKFLCDPSPWEIEYKPRFSQTNLSCRLLSGIGAFLMVSLLLFFLLLDCISGRPYT